LKQLKIKLMQNVDGKYPKAEEEKQQEIKIET
jgi:hypothetical protein